MTDNNRHHTDFLFQLDEFYLDLREDGRTISFLSKAEIERMPYPGLRPFKTSEFQFFNGRDGQAEELISRLKQNHFLAVIGSSGTGKSSLIRAGVIPQLMAGYLQEAGTNWDVALCRPGKNPVENLAVALARVKCRSNDPEKIKQDLAITEPMLSRSIYGILDFNEVLNAPDKPEQEKSNLLIIVDQFEELFRFNRDNLGKPDIETHFVNLLLKASANPELPIYVIITMRSEFLGDCVKYRGLPESINEGQYLVPQLNREQLKEVIEDPILIAGKKVAPGLVELLVNEIEESKVKKDLDQLPILQHALMRTYQNAINENAAEITYEHYLATGGLKDALSNHAQKKYDELGDGSDVETLKQKIAKSVFQALTDASTDQKKGRRPTELSVLHNIVKGQGATAAQVNEVIDHFRDTETSFIMPPSNTALFPKLIMDISHESLMRQWPRLKDWVTEEAEHGKILLRLSEYEKLNGLGVKDYLEGKELQQMLDWYRSFQPQDDWAVRYAANYKASFEYLKKSEQYQREKELKITADKKKKATKYKIIIVAALALIVITGLLVKGYYTNKENTAIARQNTARLEILLKNRDNAIGNENRLQALFYTTEALLLEKTQGNIDSIIKKSISLMPVYSLQHYILCSSAIVKATVTPGYKTIIVWCGDSTMSEIDVETGQIMRAATQIATDESDNLELTRQAKTKIFLNAGSSSVDTKDIVLTDSSLYYKKIFADICKANNNIDAAGFINFPTILNRIKGATFSADKKNIATWGQNSESIYSSLDIWDFNEEDSAVYAAGTSLIHDGINGAWFSNDKKLVFTWGTDSCLRIWQATTNLISTGMPARLIKMKIEIATGVEMNSRDFNINIIPVRNYLNRKQEFEQEERKYESKQPVK
jgi:energy-coupling factor transporter ATP-binding protein EcfA2